jgi:hypothetical protein
MGKTSRGHDWIKIIEPGFSDEQKSTVKIRSLTKERREMVMVACNVVLRGGIKEEAKKKVDSSQRC